MANSLPYGFIGLESLLSEKLEDVSVPVINDAIRESAAEHNRQLTELEGAFVQTTTEYKERFRLPQGGTLQPLDEWGIPLPVKRAGYFDIGYPIQGAGTAWGDNRVSRAMATVQDVADQTFEALVRDRNWMKRHIMGAILDNTSWTFDDEAHGNLTIQPLANGDSVTYLRTNGTLATDTHYFAQAAAIADGANPFATIRDDLTEHPGNGNVIVAYVASDLVSSIEGLTGFTTYTDPDITIGSATDQLTGTISRGFGDEVLGKVDRVWIVEWSQLPSSYAIFEARQATAPILKMRQFPASSLQGFFPEFHSPDGNLFEYRWLRYCGFGAYNRTGAAALYIGNAAYQIPTGYTTPMAY